MYVFVYIPIMRSLTSTELRATLATVMDRVNDDHEPVIVTRAGGRPVVMVSLEDWASMDETAYLLAAPANRAALRAALADLDAGRVVAPESLAEG
jgi:antitoxin YefM